MNDKIEVQLRQNGAMKAKDIAEGIGHASVDDVTNAMVKMENVRHDRESGYWFIPDGR